MPAKQQLEKKPAPPEIEERKFPLSPRFLILVFAVASIAGFGYWVFADWYFTVDDGTVATYVGRQTCMQCHQQETREWEGSHHDLAMDLATEETILGDFNNATLKHHDVTSRFFKKDGKYFVNTEGPDGKMSDFEIKYVFGVDPMQQYMVEFDRPKDMPEDEIARVQVLRLSWDINKKRWFYIPPSDVDEKLAPDDVLHWTGWAQRWNTMCADCHSTNLKKNYDHNKQRYHTTFSEIDVSCEACHGAGSTHVELAEKKTFFWDRKVGYGLAKLKSGDSDVEIHTCAQCHSRRRILHAEYHPGGDYYDHFANELLSGMTYHADGQIMDEVYVHGSFIQSKMYHKGIRCSDCHNPHSLKLKHEGNNVCTSCHQHPAGKYDTPAHHYHKDGSTGASCVECHMPETTYMVVDPRRDHSLRVPRPDLSVKIGTPNACTRCHINEDNLPSEKRGKLKQYLDWLTAARTGDKVIGDEIKRVDKWAAENFAKWYGKKDDLDDQFAVALDAIREGKDRSPDGLIALAKNKTLPAIVRATALMELTADPSEKSLDVAVALLKDRDPQVRSSALTRLEPELRQLRGTFDSINPLVNRHRNTIRQLETALQDPRYRGSSADNEPNQIVGMLRNETEALRQVESIKRQTKKAVEKHLKVLLPLLEDRTRLVRTETARMLSLVPPEFFAELTDSKERKAFDNALQEYREALLVNNDRSGALTTLGVVSDNQDDDEAAEKWYRIAMKVQPRTRGPRANLAELLERRAIELRGKAQYEATQGRREMAEDLLARSFRSQQEVEKLRLEELDLLAREAQLAPNIAEIQFRYGQALYTHKQIEQAERALLRAVALEPRNSFYPYFVGLLFQKLERWDEAEDFAGRALKLEPENQAYKNLLEAVRNRVPAS